VTTSYYNNGTGLHTLKITITAAHIKSSISSLVVSWWRILIISSAYVLTGWRISHNWESESELLYDWRFASNQFILAPSPLRLTTSKFFQLNPCGNIISGERFGLSLTTAASLPSPTGLMTTFYCFTFDTPPTWRVRFPYLYPSGTGWPSYTPRHWVSFSSLLKTPMATVEVVEPASTREYSPNHP
jgi:hypothetical protein